jgi:flavin reductase (DIM6/NTAB) family NADH-FMN oxidoreductase RutF
MDWATLLQIEACCAPPSDPKGIPMDDRLSYRPEHGSGLPHDPMAAIVGPRPIAWISTLSKQGVANLAPYSFVNMFNYKPPIVAFSSVGFKDTVRNVQDAGEFVVNLATRGLAEALNETSRPMAATESEFERAGLKTRASTCVQAPGVLESPVNLECKLLGLTRLQDLGGTPLDTWMILGQVVMVHIDRGLLSGPQGAYATLAAQPILRGGGPDDYYQLLEAGRFSMFRPKG